MKEKDENITNKQAEEVDEVKENIDNQEQDQTTENVEGEKKQEISTEELLKQLEQAKLEANEYKDKWMRNVAEFDNYKKRNAKLWQDAYQEGVSNTIIKILPVGDNLDWALTLGLDEKTAEGIKNVKKKYDETLKTLEVEEINPIGEDFDPNIAEAVMQVEGDENEKSDSVKQVLQKGYKIKDKIIRYAKVSVIK